MALRGKRFKWYNDGTLFDIIADPEEQSPIKAMTGPAAAAQNDYHLPMPTHEAVGGGTISHNAASHIQRCRQGKKWKLHTIERLLRRSRWC